MRTIKSNNVFTGFVYVIKDCLGNVIEAESSMHSILVKGHNLLLMNPENELTIDYGSPDDLSELERPLYDAIIKANRQVDPTLAKDEPLPCLLNWDIVKRMDEFTYHR